MEPHDHPIWKKRGRCLAALVFMPCTLGEIQRTALAAWGWSSWLTTNTVAACEGALFIASRVNGKWLYRPVPGVYAATTEQGRKLKLFVASTVAPKRTKAGDDLARKKADFKRRLRARVPA